VQPFDVGIGLAAITGRGADARHHEADVVVVVQGADGDTSEGGTAPTVLASIDATIDPDAA
jgi:hypothetical protein